MANLKRLLNPVDGHDELPIDTSFNAPFIDRPTFYDNATSTGSEYNGDGPRVSENLGPGFMNPASEVPIIQQDQPLDIFSPINVDSIDLNQDLPHMGLAPGFGYGFDVSDVSFLDGASNSFFPAANIIDSSASSVSPPDTQTFEDSLTPSAAGVSSQSSAATPRSTQTNNQDAVVCYGMLYNVEVRMGGNMPAVNERLKGPSQSRYQRFTLKEQKDHREHAFLLFSDDELTFGHLRSGTGKALLPLMQLPNVKFEPVGETAKLLDVIDKANKPGDAIVKVNIDVYGPRSSSSTVGKDLSQAKLWLQKSDTMAEGYEYDNPHFLRIDIDRSEDMPVQAVQQVVSNSATRKQTREEQLRKMVEEVYKTVGSNRDVDRVEGGDRVTRELLDHQKEALGFMLERESGRIANRYRLWSDIVHDDGTVEYQHKITRKRQYREPDEKGGGILADEMGMGKSLSILALVMKTLDQGQEWAKEKNEEHKDKKSINYSRSTLVVVSAALLIDNWVNEIRKHLKSGLRVIKYHGQARSKHVSEIEDSDIVVTTYHTLSAEYQLNRGKTSPLHKIAHIIRRPTTTFYRACHSLHANSRWCLTGTPIQNKLTDIGTLFSFIRANPFNNPSVFRRHIELAYEDTMGEDPVLVKERLILLLQALCLRRTREVLDLPRTRQHIVRLNFTSEERDQYEKTRNILVRTIKNRVGEIENSSKFGLFQMTLQLRILCNHGTFQKAFSWHRRSLQDEKEAVLGSHGRNVEVTCAGCRQVMPILGSNWAERVKKSSAEDDHQHYFNSDGVSTKMKAIIRDVGKDLWTTKSIIFSCWTRTLHLLSRHLRDARIPYHQIDGDCPIPSRQEKLDAFARDDDIPVLIMTTGTGAFGLNLTCANRIFIAELQWNPSVENQAIARAIRLGQENEVLVRRYVIKDTVEEEMMAQQKYKKGLAALGFPNPEDEQDWIDADIDMYN
ncbi:hypothetical protein CDV31_012012 [Fusarium ambrosium]|uniref:Helicase C-terminal domain-containing protein n=1 Tax=Fusarium ambrosium TaxID=131363 RepID=A0A428TCY8_9HYPO|nr:hypothetical protein CDV31_012012 [Fusarium ambrosium]